MRKLSKVSIIFITALTLFMGTVSADSDSALYKDIFTDSFEDQNMDEYSRVSQNGGYEITLSHAYSGDYGLKADKDNTFRRNTDFSGPGNVSAYFKRLNDGADPDHSVRFKRLGDDGMYSAGFWQEAYTDDPKLYVYTPEGGKNKTPISGIENGVWNYLEVKFGEEEIEVTLETDTGEKETFTQQLSTPVEYNSSIDLSVWGGGVSNHDFAVDQFKAERPRESLSEDQIITGDFASAFSEDWRKPESLSCVLTYAPLFKTCWVDFGIIEFGSDTEEQFINDFNAQAGVIAEDRKSTLSNLETINDQSFGISQAKAKRKAVESLNDGLTVNEARNEILKDVNTFWAARQKNIVTQHQYEVQKFKNALATADSAGLEYSELFERNASDYKIFNETYGLANGSNATVYEVYTGDGELIHSAIDPSGPGLVANDTGEKFLAGSEYADELSSTENLRQQAYDNVQTLVDGIYEEYNPGDLNVSQVLGPLEALQTSATEYAETGGTSYLATTFEQMGLSTDFDNAFTVTYKNTDMNDSKTVEGQLFGNEEDFPNGFEVNETYDASSKTVWMVYQPENGNAESVEFNDSFTVDKIQSLDTGEALNKTVIEQQEFYTTNITALESQLDKIRQDQRELRNAGGFSIGGSGFFQNLQNTIGGILIVLLILGVGAFFS